MRIHLFCILLVPLFSRAELPTTEGDIIAHFEKAGARITKNEAGEAVRFFSGGKPPHSVEELQLLGKLKQLEQIALNNPVAGNDEWQFLSELPNLKTLTIWHCKTISSLEPFSGLAIESLTVGGSMGLRDLNRENPEKHRDTVLTLHDLPNLRAVNLYHSPLLPGDEHIAHLVRSFPKLEDIKIDVNAPREFETTISPEGLKRLAELPVKVISLENIGTFTPAHIEVVAGIPTLEALLIDCRKNPIDLAPLVAAAQKANPDLEIVVADENASGPPRRSRK